MVRRPLRSTRTDNTLSRHDALPIYAPGDYASALGAEAWASGENSTAVCFYSTAYGDDSVALGANSIADADNSVALGAGSIADRDNSVSVGSAGNERQITNVAAGTEDTDAVNLAQLQEVAKTADNTDHFFQASDDPDNPGVGAYVEGINATAAG